jgi:hypothetical protein
MRKPSEHQSCGPVQQGPWRMLAAGFAICLTTGPLLAQAGPVSAAPSNTERTGGLCHKLASLPVVPGSPTGSSTERSTSVTVRVVAVTEVVLTDSGKPSMARTNTNEPPSCGDVFVALDGPFDTTVRGVSLAVVNETMDAQFFGSWHSGAWTVVRRH